MGTAVTKIHAAAQSEVGVTSVFICMVTMVLVSDFG